MKNLTQLKRQDLQFNGVYKITNIKNNKSYIGSCSSKTFLYERLIHHREDLIKNKHANLYLQRSFNKYGIENFYFEIIESCNSENCISREQYWIDLLKPHYNLCKKAGSSFGRKCTQKTKDKISEANKKFWANPENHKRMMKALKKRVRTKPYKSGYKNPNYKLSEEGKKRLSEAKAKKVINLNTNEVYESVTEAAKKLNMSIASISMMLNGKRTNKFNLKWKK